MLDRRSFICALAVAGASKLSPLEALVNDVTITRVQQVWDIYSPRNCYGQDLGSIVHRPGWDRWLLFYGAVNDYGFPACAKQKLTDSTPYGENVWLTWSMNDGKEFGQGGMSPILAVSGGQFARYLADNECPTGTMCPVTRNASHWLIGDPAVEIGESGTWYMFFDTQWAKCDGNPSPDNLPPPNGFYVASTNEWNRFPWPIRGRPKARQPDGTLTELPGRTPFNFQSLYKDPATKKLLFYYNDANITTRAAEVVDDGVGTTLLPANDGAEVIRNFPPCSRLACNRPSNRISPFFRDGKYYAAADNFGNGTPGGAPKLWLLGPSDTPFSFDWNSRRALLEPTKDTFYDITVGFPSAIGPDYTGDGTTRVYFWADGTPGCWPVPSPSGERVGTHNSAGVIILDDY